MKKTIASMALIASASSAVGMIRPPGSAPVVTPGFATICLNITNVNEDGSMKVGECDESDNNRELEREIKENGCSVNQVAIESYDLLKIKSCRAPGFAQL